MDATVQMPGIAWGRRVSPAFKGRVILLSKRLFINPSDLMGCMAWESNNTFSSSVKNTAGSGAVGLIQFMPSTAKALGTSTAALATMPPEDQLDYVEKYFHPYAGKLLDIGDLYMAILWPKGVGKSEAWVVWDAKTAPITFKQNIGLDVNHDGIITKGECIKKVKERLAEGMKPGNFG